MTYKPIDNLTLERLAAGVFSEEESARIMAELEKEEGGLERLNALLRSNEEFFENHPADVVVPQIVDQYKRQKRRQEGGENKMAQGLGLKIAFGVAALAGTGFLVTKFAADSEPALAEPAVAQSPEVEKPGEEKVEAAIVEETQVAGDSAKKGVANLTSSVLREIDELLIVNGESITFEPKGVTRVAVEQSKLLQTQGDKEGITFTGMMPGITGMQVHTKDGVRTAYVRVSDAYPEELLVQMKTDLEPSIESCSEEHGAGMLHARVLIDRSGVVLKMLWDPQTEGSDALLNCAAESIQAREFPVKEPGEVTIARFKW